MEKHHIQNNFLSAIITREAAQLISLQANDQEYIYQQTGTWKKSWPVCFPWAGRFFNNTYWYNQREHEMKSHGFFMQMPWLLTNQASDEVTFTYRHQGHFYQDYPFLFCIAITYQLKDNSLLCRVEIVNEDDKTMLFGFGWHPAFLVNSPTTTISFPKTVKVTSFLDASFIYHNEPVFETDHIKLSDLQFQNNEHYAVMNQQIDEVAYNDDQRQVALKFRNYEQLLLWTTSLDDNFLCLEPWMSHQDHYRHRNTPLNLKPFVQKLAAFQKVVYELVVEIIS